jgi:hypothetical protein
MLDCLKPIKNEKWDCLSFFEGEKDDQISIEGTSYKEPGEYHIGANKGQMYHIVLVKDHSEDVEKFEHFDQFEAVLFDPLEYVSGLIPCGWYGVVAKKTDNSHKFIEDVVDKLKSLL